MVQHEAKKVKVSVIICTYNQEKLIGRCIESIVHQESRVPFEVIIGEDASQDNTRTVCEDYAKRYPYLIRMMEKAPNKGVLQNYYDCVKAARGEYIMECGGDDEWCPGRINLCLDIMEQHSEVVQVFTDVWFRYKKTGRVVQSNAHNIIAPGIIRGEEMTKVLFNHWPAYYAMTRRNIMMELMCEHPRLFSGCEFLTEDHQLAVLAGTKGDAFYIPQPTYYYDKGESATSSENESKMGRFHLNMLSLMCELAAVVALPPSVINEGFNERLFKILMHAFRARDKKLREDAIEASEKMGISPLSASVKLCEALTSNAVTWTLALYLRRIALFVKSLREKRMMS